MEAEKYFTRRQRASTRDLALLGLPLTTVPVLFREREKMKIRKFVLYFTFLNKVVKHGHHPLL